MPLWQAALGGVVAIVVAKQMFGGLGQKFCEPGAGRPHCADGKLS